MCHSATAKDIITLAHTSDFKRIMCHSRIGFKDDDDDVRNSDGYLRTRNESPTTPTCMIPYILFIAAE